MPPNMSSAPSLPTRLRVKVADIFSSPEEYYTFRIMFHPNRGRAGNCWVLLLLSEFFDF